MKPVHRQLLALLLAVVLGSALCLSLYVWDNKYTRPGAQPMDGLLTLTDEELEQTDLHFLIHGWAFYPGVLLTPEEWTAHGTEHYMIYTSIGERTRFDQPDGVTPHGYGTYVLTLELPEDPAQYGLELPEIYSAYRLYLNGNLELQVGNRTWSTTSPAPRTAWSPLQEAVSPPSCWRCGMTPTFTAAWSIPRPWVRLWQSTSAGGCGWDWRCA